MKLSALVAKERQLVIRVGDGDDDVVNVTYAPGALTLETADKIEALQQGMGGAFDAIQVVLEPCLVAWDLEKDDGSPLPCNMEGLKQVPLEFLGMLFQAITDDSQPNPLMAGTSDVGSAPTGASADIQNGTESSPRQGSLV